MPRSRRAITISPIKARRLRWSKAGVGPADAALLALAEAVRAHDAQATNAAIDRIGGGPLDFMVPILRAWQAYDDGKDPFALLAGGTQNPLGAPLYRGREPRAAADRDGPDR